MKIAIAFILAATLASPVSAQPKVANNPQDLVNMEAAWSKAIVARDGAALNRIVAPDWTGQSENGKLVDRAAMIKHTLTDETKLSWMNNHDVHVRFIGDGHAIVQGMDNETGTKQGKKVSHAYSWTDIFEKRGGHWIAIASQNTPLK